AAVAAVVHARVFPGLYPAFHEVLVLAAAFGAAEAGAALAGALRMRAGAAVVLGVVVGVPGAWLAIAEPGLRARAQRALPLYAVAIDPLVRRLPQPPAASVALPRVEPWPERLLDESLARLRAAGLPERPSFLLITIDALPATRLAAAGETRGVTPNLDAAATRGWSFDRAYAPASITFASVRSMMRGLTFDRSETLVDPEAAPRMAERFGALGYRTFAAYPAEAVFAGREIGRDYLSDDSGFAETMLEHAPDALRVERFLAFLDADPETPFCAWLHFMGPHHPYAPLDGPRFGESAEARHAAEVFEADRLAGDLLERLAARGLAARTVVALSADHGEEFGERNGLFHGTTVYDEQVRVPLVVVGPGLQPRRTASAVSLTDLLPTFLHLAGVREREDLDGRSWAPLGTGLADGADRTAFVVQRHPVVHIDLRAVVRMPWKAILDVRSGVVECFHLENDPGERRPLPAPDAPFGPEMLDLLRAPPPPHVASRAPSERMRVVVAAQAHGDPADPRWPSLLSDPSSGVRVAAVDALSAFGGEGDDLLRAFALAPGPASDAERVRALEVVNARPRWDDLDHFDDRVRYACAKAAETAEAPPYDRLRARLAAERNPHVLTALVNAIEREPRPSDEVALERLALRDDFAGATAAARLALRRLGPASRPGAAVVRPEDVAVRADGPLGVRVEVPAASPAELAQGRTRVWAVFVEPPPADGAWPDGKTVEPTLFRGDAPWPFVSHVIERGCLVAFDRTTEPLTLTVTGLRSTPAFFCALPVEPRP
ncbi:MAG TPA: sulfatase, partial [Planctomycetota bacterium]|nr:sulfatase [Planctomycetota bacterium]